MLAMLSNWILRLAALVGVAASAWIAWEHVSGNGATCSFDQGCDTVLADPRTSLTMAVVGILTFSFVFVLSLTSRVRLLRVTALVIGVGGASLILVQALILGAMCPKCLVVDTAGIVVALAAFMPRSDPVHDPVVHALWTVCLLPALIIPPSIAWMFQPEVPAEVSRHWVEGKVTIVEVTDFECPTCRHVDGLVREVEQLYSDRVRCVRIMVPLERHFKGRTAGRAYYCSLEQGKDLSQVLFDAQDLSPEYCRTLAQRQGVDVEKYDACILDRGLDERFAKDMAWVKSSGASGVPVLWVQEEMVSGRITKERLQEAVEGALARLEGKEGKKNAQAR